jgi:hypothetical protein
MPTTRRQLENAARRSGCLPMSLPTIFALSSLLTRDGATAEAVVAAIKSRRPDLFKPAERKPEPRPEPKLLGQVEKFRQKFGDNYRPPTKVKR